MARNRRTRYRTTKAIQQFWEHEIFDLETMTEFLQEGQAGYIAGENTKNPEWIESSAQRRKMRMQCMTKLQTLLPFHEAEQRIAEAEQKIRGLTVTGFRY